MNRSLRITRNVLLFGQGLPVFTLKFLKQGFTTQAYLSTSFGPDEPGNGTEIVIICADEDPEHGGLGATPLHVLRRLNVWLHLYWRLTPRIRF